MKTTGRRSLDAGGFAASAQNDGMGKGQGVDVAEGEVQGEWTLPDRWVWTTIGDVADTTSGGTPSRKRSRYYMDGTIPWVKSGELRDGVVSNAEESITKEALDSSSARVFPKDTPLVALYGATVGRTGILGINAATNQAVCAIFAWQSAFTPEFIVYWLRFQRPQLIEMSSGGAQPNISQQIVRAFPLPLAPLPEQRRIVAEIETQFTRLDAGVAALERARANLRRYKASVLKAACEGRLVPTEAELARAGGRDYEPADQLLTCILAERRARWEAENPGKKHKEPAPPDTEGLPELPEGWAYSLIEPLLSTSRSGMKTGPFGSLLKKHEHRPEGIPVLGIENIGPTGYVPGNKIFITEKKADQLSKYDVQPNDILISRSGTVGEVCIVPEGLGPARFSTNLMRIVLTPNSMLPKFFIFLFNGSPFVLDQVSELCSGSTRDFLNQKILKSVVFPLPPLPEQRRIVAEVERRLSVVAALEASVEAALARARRLRQAVLKRAFEGRLVPQDPNDEPASVLLERIRAQRETGKKAGKTNRKKKQLRQLELL